MSPLGTGMDFQCASPSNTSLYCLLYCDEETEERTVDSISCGVAAQRFAGKVKVHAPCDSVSDDKRRRGQIIGANQRMNAALKVAIAAQDGNGDQIVVLDGGADRFR